VQGEEKCFGSSVSQRRGSSLHLQVVKKGGIREQRGEKGRHSVPETWGKD